MGVCLPLGCGARDVSQLVELSAHHAKLDSLRTVYVETVKSPENQYIMSEDPIFVILLISTTIIAAFLIAGTMLDLYRQRKLAKRGNFTYDNYTFVFSKSTHCSINTGTVPVINNNSSGTETPPDASDPTTESNSVTSDDTVLKTSLWSEILLSFSLRRNLKTICDQSVGADTIPTVHGLRSLSMAWVILGHTCIVAFKYSDNMSYRGVVEREFLFQTINNGAFSVDTFFFISGLLVSFLYFRTTAKHDVTKLTRTKGFLSYFVQFIGMITYRFCRLTGPYLFVLGVVQVSMKWFHYNSVFEPPAADHINCPQYWWRNLLYINTLFPVKDMCMLWSWYLADDTQFFVLGTILLIMAVKNFQAAASLMVTFLVSSWITTMYIAYTNEHMPNLDDPLALFDKIYDKPWTRLGPYLVGMSVGWILFKTDCKIKMHKGTVTVGWTLSVSLLMFLVYGLYEQELHPVTAAAYSSFSHTLWALGLAWIVVACSTGYGGFVNKVLSATVLYPFSRVTYCAYLVHPIFIRIFAMKMDSPIHLGKDLVVIMFFGVLVVSYILSLIISLVFEAPAVALLKIVSFKQKTK